MSAFLVSEDHIRYLIQAGLCMNTYGNLRWFSHGTESEQPRQLGELDDHNASEVGNMLWRENHASVSYRYNAAGGACPVYVHDKAGAKVFRIDPVWVLKLIQCYEYQACEHPGWCDSAARAFCEALQTRAIHHLPGYDDAPWGL